MRVLLALAFGLCMPLVALSFGTMSTYRSWSARAQAWLDRTVNPRHPLPPFTIREPRAPLAATPWEDVEWARDRGLI